jgi:hypothetical protein
MLATNPSGGYMERSEKVQLILAAATLAKDPSQLEQSVKEVLKVLRNKEVWAAVKPVKNSKI